MAFGSQLSSISHCGDERDTGSVLTNSLARRHEFIALAAWSALIGGMWLWYCQINGDDALEMARTHARAAYEKDLTYRRWNASHGGVYVPVTDKTRPNPLLHVPDRDISTPSGRKLTLVNPAFMTRQVFEAERSENKGVSRIISRKPLNPSNAPDSWEEKALLAFEAGEKEASDVVHEGGQAIVRLIRPLYVEESCLKCHAAQGYRRGDVRGAISVSVPANALWDSQMEQFRQVSLGYGVLWLAGCFGILVASRSVRRRVAERDRAERVLRESEERLRTMIETSPDAIGVLSFTGRVLMANQQAAILCGFDRVEDLVSAGLTVFDFLPPEEHQRAEANIRRLPEVGILRGIEYCCIRRNGDRVPVEMSASVLRDPYGMPNAVLIAVRDITDRKRTEAELQHSEALYRSLVDNVDVGITLITSDHAIVMTNSAQAQMFRKDPAAFQGKKCFREFEKRSVPCAHCPGRVAMATGRPAEVETEGVRDDGATFSVRVKAFPMFDANGAVSGFIEQVEETTERKRAHALMKHAKEEAEAANRAKSEFLANMSHEIRTPLTAILGYANVMLDDPDSPEARDAADTIKRNGENLLQIISDILDLSKIEAARLEPECESCSPRQIVNDVATLMRGRAEAKQLFLATEFVEPLPDRIWTDPLRLRQILTNLVGNAIKFTETGGVRIVTQLVCDGDNKPRIRFDVIDTGIGLEERQIGMLFQPFMQVDTSARRRFGGSGLGLAISRKLARLLGGDIEVRSSPGKGSTFSVSLLAGTLDPPVELDSPLPARSLRPQLRDDIGLNCRVLLAEDGPDNQRLVSYLLRKAGAEVVVVDNGKAAVEAAISAGRDGRAFDAILMDIQMPVMDGYAATMQLRHQGFTGPILALTAHAMPEDREKCLGAGCNGHLTKPIDIHELTRLIALHLPEAASPRADAIGSS